MSTALTTQPALDAKSIEQVLLGGDLSKLSAEQRVSYYGRVCESLGLNPLTKPFDYLTLNGKTVLYARKDATEQLRTLRGISVTIVGREVVEDCYVVTARAKNTHGREDESIGAVNIGGLKGEARANAMMKSETKAKRRVTLSICGLGMLDELEVDSIPSAQVGEPLPPVVIEAPAPVAVIDAPEGTTIIVRTEAGQTSRGKKYWTLTLFGGEDVIVWDQQLGVAAESHVQNKTPLTMDFKGEWDGKRVVKGFRPYTASPDPKPASELSAEEIPF